MRGTWNPTRRNRNIGTSKSGHGKDNKLVIPDRFMDFRVFWERIENYTVYTREVNGREITFIVEPNKINYAYSCTVDDIVFLLSHIPAEDWEGIKLFIFRQPSKKEEILSTVWGRLGYNVDIGAYKGPSIFLEAVDLSKPLVWGKSLSPEKAKELERLKDDGHLITQNKRGYKFEYCTDSVRNTQLYRTLLHEIGHWVHWQTEVLRPASEGFNIDDLKEKYFSISSNEKETFANRYADSMKKRLIESNIIPFKSIGNTGN